MNIFYSHLEDSNFSFSKGDLNMDVNIVNSNFKNSKLHTIGLLSNKEWRNPDYRQTFTISGSELIGENKLKETTFVEDSILQDVSLANVSKIKHSFLKEINRNYQMPATIEGVDSTAERELQNGIIIDRSNEDFEAL